MLVSKPALAFTLLTAAAKTVVSFVPSQPPATATTTTTLSAVPEGWKGGFKDTHPDFCYHVVQPDLSDLPIMGNLENMEKITRMQRIFWPQFSWQSIPGDESSRIYEVFAQDMSRIGYDDDGRIWSIICPQRGRFIPGLGTVFIEVTVHGVRGWIDEPSHSGYADIGVVGTLWIEADENPVVEFISNILDDLHFPFSKEHAAKVKAFPVGKPYEEFWPMTNGTDPAFFHPQFAQHWEEAFSVYNLQVEVGKQIMTGEKLVDDFNAMVIELFNSVSGNIFAPGQRVAWTLWTNEPEIVDTEEWKGHADKWYHSIKVNHKYPEGDEGVPLHFDGRPFVPELNLEDTFKFVKEYVEENEDELKKKIKKPEGLVALKFITEFLFGKKMRTIEQRISDRIAARKARIAGFFKRD